MTKIICIAACLSLLSCRYAPLEKPAPFVNHVRLNEKFCVNLPEDHSKNANWRMASADRRVRVLGEVWHGNEKGIDFNFIARDTGIATIEFVQFSNRDTSARVDYILKITDN